MSEDLPASSSPTDPELVPASEVDEAAMVRFLSYCRHKTIPRNHLILRKGDPADTLAYIISGSATVLMEDETSPHNDIILAYLDAGDFIGEMGLFYETDNRDTLIRAKTTCELAEISYRELQVLFNNKLKSAKADILTVVGRQLSQRLMRTSRKVGQLAFLDVTGRVARTLLDLTDSPNATPHPQGIQVSVSRQEIARIVGCSREMVSRVLKNLVEQDMVILINSNIVVLNSG